MNWSNLWALLKPVVIKIITNIIIPLLLGSAGGLVTYHVACQPVAPVPAAK